MGNSICLDTDILVDFLRNKKEAVKWISEAEKENSLCTTTINAFEIYMGAYLSNNPEEKIKNVENLLARLIILNISLKSVKIAANQNAVLKKKGNLIEYKDLLIGTAALLENCAIKTNNKKHFQRIDGLKVM